MLCLGASSRQPEAATLRTVLVLVELTYLRTHDSNVGLQYD